MTSPAVPDAELIERLHWWAAWFCKDRDEKASAAFSEAASRLAELQAERTWQPIETAPKDGREIILTDGEHVEHDHWVRWPSDGESWDRFRYLEPTHWMPLPKPPALSASPIAPTEVK